MDKGMTTLAEWAEYYAGLGIPVFPLNPRSKQPATTHGCKDATTELDKVRGYWTVQPDLNIGLATGNGFFVVDLDVDEDKGVNGYELLRDWERETGKKLPETWTAITGRGGYHLFYRDNSTVRNSVGVRDGVDVRGEGGYIVAPPSVHPNGRRYEWETAPEDMPAAQANGAVFDFILPPAPEKKASFSLPDSIPEGERTQTLFRLVSSLQAKGLSDEAIRAAVRAQNEACCQPPLTEKELEQEVFPAIGRYEKGTAPYAADIQRRQAERKQTVAPKILTLSTAEEHPAEWLIPEYIPLNQITCLVGDGGSGKTSIWCDIAASISAGKPSILRAGIPFVENSGPPGRVLFLSSEDSVESVLIGKLRRSGANMENISYVPLEDEGFSEIKFGSQVLEDMIREYRPRLGIFDPVQSFVPGNADMAKRNAMRSCMNPMLRIAQKYGTTFLFVVHTNKLANVWGRKRMADSADLWDISRSVLIVGETPEGLRYISQEKCNYGPRASTVLFSLDGGVPTFKGYTGKTDRDYILGQNYARKAAPDRDAAKKIILEYLEDGKPVEVSELDGVAIASGVSQKTLERAKTELKSEGVIKIWSTGYGKKKVFYVGLSSTMSEGEGVNEK